MKYTNTEEDIKVEENEVHENTKEYIRGDLNDEDFEEWF